MLGHNKDSIGTSGPLLLAIGNAYIRYMLLSCEKSLFLSLLERQNVRLIGFFSPVGPGHEVDTEVPY